MLKKFLSVFFVAFCTMIFFGAWSAAAEEIEPDTSESDTSTLKLLMIVRTDEADESSGDVRLQLEKYIPVREFKKLVGLSEETGEEQPSDEPLTKRLLSEILNILYGTPGTDRTGYLYGLDVAFYGDDELHTSYLEGVIRGLICPLYIADDYVTRYEAYLVAYVIQKQKMRLQSQPSV